MDTKNPEVTLFFTTCKHRNLEGQEQTFYSFKRLARVRFERDDVSFAPVVIDVDDAPLSTTEGEGVRYFLLERSDVQDNGGGEVVHEVLAENEA